MKRTLRVSCVLTVAAFSAAGCERSSKYAEPPASSYSVERFTLATEVADTVTGAVVSPEFFTAATVRPWLGRFFFESEYSSAAKPVVVISNELWRRRFNAAPQVIGTVVPVNGRAMTLIGVAPPDFEWPTGAELWVPLVPR
jgi:putative ABC transport system permease protein